MDCAIVVFRRVIPPSLYSKARVSFNIGSTVQSAVQLSYFLMIIATLNRVFANIYVCV